MAKISGAAGAAVYKPVTGGVSQAGSTGRARWLALISISPTMVYVSPNCSYAPYLVPWKVFMRYYADFLRSVSRVLGLVRWSFSRVLATGLSRIRKSWRAWDLRLTSFMVLTRACISRVIYRRLERRKTSRTVNRRLEDKRRHLASSEHTHLDNRSSSGFIYLSVCSRTLDGSSRSRVNDGRLDLRFLETLDYRLHVFGLGGGCRWGWGFGSFWKGGVRRLGQNFAGWWIGLGLAFWSSLWSYGCNRSYGSYVSFLRSNVTRLPARAARAFWSNILGSVLSSVGEWVGGMISRMSCGVCLVRPGLYVA